RVARLDVPAQRLDLGAMNGGAADADLEAVVLGRIVAAGHLNRAVEIELEEREVADRGWAGAEIDDLEPGFEQSAADFGSVSVGSQAAIAPDADASPPDSAALGDVGGIAAPERVREGGVEVALGGAADV